MNKKHVAWLAASVAAVTLIAGCGGNADTSNNKDAGKIKNVDSRYRSNIPSL